MPLSVSSLAVPPVERISTSRSLSWRANATTPDLSETLIRARWMRDMRLLLGELGTKYYYHGEHGGNQYHHVFPAGTSAPCSPWSSKLSIQSVQLEFLAQGTA